MKRIFYLLLGSVFLVYGCSNGDEVQSPEIEQVEIKDKETVQLDNSGTEGKTLEVIKQYTEDMGDLEAYYIKEDINETYGEQGIDVTIQSVEYGKVLVNETYRSTYENFADEEGKNTYIKVGMEITGDASQFPKHTFYASYAIVQLDNKETGADSTFSDDVSINGSNNTPPISGYIYFLVDNELPINEIKLKIPAPYSNDNKLSITEDYIFEIDLE